MLYLTLATMMAIPRFSVISKRETCFPVSIPHEGGINIPSSYRLETIFFPDFILPENPPIIHVFQCQFHKLKCDKTHLKYQLSDPVFSRVLHILTALINISNDSGTIHFNRHSSLFYKIRCKASRTYSKAIILEVVILG